MKNGRLFVAMRWIVQFLMPRLHRTSASAGAPGRTNHAASIQDVAEVAGVSTATVSRVLNRAGLVAPATAERVRRAISALGYRPNRFAQGLTTRRSRVLGIALPDIHGEFYSELLRGADAEARRHGYHLLVSSEGRVGPEGNGAVDAAGEGRRLAFGLVDGLAVMLTEPNDGLWRELRALALPVVVLDAEVGEVGSPGSPGLPVDTVIVDDAVGAREATEHLLRGCPPDRCYFVGGARENYDTQRRAAAFVAALRGAGHVARPEQTAYGRYTVEWGCAWGAERFVRGGAGGVGGVGGVGVLAGNDEIALGVMHAAEQAGLRVPGDVRVVGFDDTRLASLVRPSLSTVRIPLAEVGAAAIGRLVERVERPGGEAVSVRVTPRLIVRESSVA